VNTLVYDTAAGAVMLKMAIAEMKEVIIRDISSLRYTN